MAEMNKTKRILNYLKKNPDHTWKNASSKLEKYGISGPYFSMIKSKHTSAAGAEGAEGEEGVVAASPRKTRKKKATQSSSTGTGDLNQAVAFAKAMGGIDQAKAALSQLEQYQIGS